jgi:hypothetical protein
MLAVRRQHKAFGWGEFAWLETNANKAVAAYYRKHEGECLLVINNLSGEPQPLRFSPNEKSAAAPVDQLTRKVVPLNEDGRVHFDLQPYQYLWLKLGLS